MTEAPLSGSRLLAAGFHAARASSAKPRPGSAAVRKVQAKRPAVVRDDMRPWLADCTLDDKGRPIANVANTGHPRWRMVPRGGRTISALDLFECSLVSTPMHPGAHVTTVKGAQGNTMADDNNTAPAAELETRVDGLEGRVTTLEETVVGLSGGEGEAEQKSLGSRLDKLEARLNRPGMSAPSPTRVTWRCSGTGTTGSPAASPATAARPCARKVASAGP